MVRQAIQTKVSQTMYCVLEAQNVNNNLISAYMEKNSVKLDGSYLDIDEMTIYPKKYFCSKSYGTHATDMTPSTYCIHYYTFSWSEPETVKGYVKKYVVVIVGERLFRKIVNRIKLLYR